ncbi:MAG: hypothetical protein ABIA92_03025 [Patescibacteria group bacterium]
MINHQGAPVLDDTEIFTVDITRPEDCSLIESPDLSARERLHAVLEVTLDRAQIGNPTRQQDPDRPERFRIVTTSGKIQKIKAALVDVKKETLGPWA